MTVKSGDSPNQEVRRESKPAAEDKWAEETGSFGGKKKIKLESHAISHTQKEKKTKVGVTIVIRISVYVINFMTMITYIWEHLFWLDCKGKFFKLINPPK